jgi:hypothetical protein
MANTTFNGPVRSENGFQDISINSSTGAVTVDATFGANTTVSTLSATGNVTADSGTAPAAGGMAAFLMSSTAGLGIYVGSGLPTVSAAQGSLYIRTDGSSGTTRMYVNTNGTTGWTAVNTVA